MNKPLVITLNEFKTTMASVINNAIQQENLPCYLLEPIMAELLAQLREGARGELQMAKDQMAQEQTQTENTEEG